MTEGLGSADFAAGGERTVNLRDAKWERANAELDRLWARGREVLGCDLAIMGGAMTWVSERNLVAAISKAGGFGVIASGSMSPEQLSKEIQATQAITTRPFGVNLITLHPELLELIDVCSTHNVGHVVLAGGLPGNAAVSRVKRSGARVFCFSPALGFARKLVRMGVDAIVIEGNEAGGHIGPVSTGVLAQEILPHLTEVPVFVAGGVGRGEAMLAYLEMGASGVQLGTRFVCAHESIAREIIDRFTRGELSQKEAQLEIEHFWAGALRRAVIDGDVDAGSLMAGQSVGFVTREQSAAEILHELVGQALAALATRNEHACDHAPGSELAFLGRQIARG